MSSNREFLLKWKLMVTTLPIILLVLLGRFLIEKLVITDGHPFSGLMDFAAIAPVLTAGVFLLGLMLSGTMTDYKESEKIPGEIACTLESIAETIDWAASNRATIPVVELQKTVVAVTADLIAWFYKQRTHGENFASIERLNVAAKELDKAGAINHANRLLGEINALRKLVTRASVISRTGFLASGYAMLDTLVAAVLLLLIGCSFKQDFGQVGKYVIISFIALTYTYMWRLIRDLDDPFEYAADGQRSGAAEIELFPLLEYHERQKSRRDISASAAQ